jgi:hypothetical protein
LCRHFGDRFVPLFKPHLEKFVKSDKDNQQRFVCEFVTGLLQGSKFWPLQKLEFTWTWLRPLLEQGFRSINSESLKDWGTAVATIFDSRDPRKFYWLVELLFEYAAVTVESSFQRSRYFQGQ